MTTSGQSGLPLRGDGRPGRVGRWWRTDSPAGGERGALQLDQAAIDAPGALDRVVSTVAALRRRGLPGVLPVDDLVSEADRVWLLTSAPAEPTVAQLLTTRDVPAQTALRVLLGTGRALLGLHQAGLVHGALGADTVVLDRSGASWLIEVGLLPALSGGRVPPADDVAGWATLARTLAAGLDSAAVVELLHRGAAEAESAGLGAALELLAADPAAPPARAAVPAAADLMGTVLAPGAFPPAASTVPGGADESTVPVGADGPTVPVGADGPTVPVGADAFTVPVDADAAAEVTQAVGAVPGATGAATEFGQRPAVNGPPPSAGVQPTKLRFGPGVSAAAQVPAWRTGAAAARPRRRRGRKVLSGLLTFAILGGVVGYLWWQRQDPLAVTAVEVAPAEPVEPQCDVTVDVVGTVHTTGSGGILTYQWIRSDGEVTAVQDQRVAAGASSTQVHLFWSFSGEGSYDATATLRILKPTPTEGSGAFTYSCS